MQMNKTTFGLGFGLLGAGLLAIAAPVSAGEYTAPAPMDAPATMDTPATMDMPGEEPMAAEPTTPGTIVDVAAGNENFSTLVAAVEAAGLAESLSGEGPFTVFAPTDEAFAALPEGTLEFLLLPENQGVLAQILSYHVVPGTVTSGDLMAGAVTTAEGSDVMVSLTDGVMVNDANVVTADITASNGVIHVIDKVILPPSLQ